MAFLAALGSGVAHPEPGASWADPSGNSVGALQEITVTATRREQSITSVPYNISALSGLQLEDANVSTLSQLAKLVPGVVFAEQGVRDSGTNNLFVIRGINAEAGDSVDFARANASPVSTYLDNTPLFTNLRLQDLRRVEVLRGPQGTLYGSGSLGGTIRFIANPPDLTSFAANVQADVSHTQSSNGPNGSIEVMGNFPISETVAFRTSDSYTRIYGFTSAPNRYVLDASGVPVLTDPADPLNSPAQTQRVDRIDSSEVFSARQSLSWKPDEHTQIQIRYFHQRDQADGRSADTFGQPGFGTREQGTLLGEPLRRDVDLVDLDLGVDVGFADLAGSLSYASAKDRQTSDNSGYFETALADFYGGIARLYVPSDLRSSSSSTTAEFRLSSTRALWDRLDWIVGAYYSRQNARSLESDPAPGIDIATGSPGLSEILFAQTLRTRFEDEAVFTEDTLHMTDAWQVTAGLRAFRQKSTSDLTTQFPNCGPDCAADGLDPLGTSVIPSVTRSFSSTTSKFNTSYRFGSGSQVYATVSQGFRRGGANSVPTAGAFGESPEFLTYKPDRTTNHEIGVKGRFKNLRYTAALFLIDWKDIQLQAITPNGGYFAIVNLGRARSKGAEVELNGSLGSGTDWAINYTVSQAALTQDFAFVNLTGHKGDQLPGTPKYSGSASVDHHYPFGAGWTLHGHADLSYRSSTTNAIDPNSAEFARFGGYSVVNLSLGIESGPWAGRLYTSNLFDIRGAHTRQTAAIYGPDHALTWYEQPRTLGLSVTYRFDSSERSR